MFKIQWIRKFNGSNHDISKIQEDKNEKEVELEGSKKFKTRQYQREIKKLLKAKASFSDLIKSTYIA